MLVISSNLALEGRAILVDGQGTLITTESCLVNANRNPGLSRTEVDAELIRVPGVTEMFWLPGDPSETETDGRIDGLMVLSAPARAPFEINEDSLDARFEILRENRRALELAIDARGRRFDIAPIEEVDRGLSVGERYCRAYVNFCLVNGAVISPAYGVASDARVESVLRGAFPDCAILMLPIGEIAVGGGGFHCIPQPQPARGTTGSA